MGPVSYKYQQMKANSKNNFCVLLLLIAIFPAVVKAQSLQKEIKVDKRTLAGDPIFTGVARGTLIPFKGANGELPLDHTVDKELTGRNYKMVKDGEWIYADATLAQRAVYTFKNGRLHGAFRVFNNWGKIILQGTCADGAYERIYYTGYQDDNNKPKIKGELVCLVSDLEARQGGPEIFRLTDIIRINEETFDMMGKPYMDRPIVTGQWTTWWEDGTEATRFNFTTGEIKPVNARRIDRFPYYKKNERVVDYYGSGDRYLHLPGEVVSGSSPKMYTVALTDLQYVSSFLRTGTWEYYRLEGSKKVLLEKTNYDWKTNEPQGSSTTYYANGNKKSELQFNKGKLEGPAVYFHDNNTISAKGNYSNNKKTGAWAYYFKDGTLSQEENFAQDGNLQGEYKIYFANGQLKEKGARQNGQIHGVVTFYHPNGKVAGGNHYSNGVFTKPADYFDSNGKAVMTNGTGTQTYYHPNGKISFKAIFRNFCRDGLSEWFYDNGQLQQSAIYKYSDTRKPDGLRWEVISSYTRNGEKRNAGTLRNGNGVWIAYDENGNATRTTYQNGVKVDAN